MNRPCRIGRLQWQIDGLRHQLREALAERDELQHRIYAWLGQRGGAKTY